MAGTRGHLGPPRKGPPRKADHRTGASAAFARAVAASLPDVEASEDRGDTSFAVAGTVFLSVENEDDGALVWSATADEERLALLTLGRDEVRARIELAWESYAPPTLARAYRAKRARWARQPALTCDDIRRAVLALPGANEGPIWGQDLGFRVGDEKRTRFARFGPPEGSRVGNLLPPDDADTLVIFFCREKPALLRSRADLFFTTPHYGSDDEPGGIIARLCEHRGKQALAVLAALLEDSWRAAVARQTSAAPARKKARKKR